MNWLQSESRSFYLKTGSFILIKFIVVRKELELSKKLKKLFQFYAVIIDAIGYVQQSKEEIEILLIFSQIVMNKEV